MTARTAAYDGNRKPGEYQMYPMLGAEKIFKGMPVYLKATGRYAFTNDGTTNTLAAGDIFVGIAAETIDNTGVDGAKYIRVYRKGNFKLPMLGTLTQGKVGSPVYSNNTSDDAAVTLTSDASGQPQVRIGTVTEFLGAAEGYVQIDNHVDGVVANVA